MCISRTRLFPSINWYIVKCITVYIPRNTLPNILYSSDAFGAISYFALDSPLNLALVYPKKNITRKRNIGLRFTRYFKHKKPETKIHFVWYKVYCLNLFFLDLNKFVFNKTFIQRFCFDFFIFVTVINFRMTFPERCLEHMPNKCPNISVPEEWVLRLVSQTVRDEVIATTTRICRKKREVSE